MKKWLPAFLLLLAPATWGQQTTVTGTVLDPNGTPYQNGSGRAQLVPTNVGWTVNNGQPLNQTVQVIAQLDSFGRFSTTVTSTNIIDQQSSNPQWQFSFCSATYTSPFQGQICFTLPPLTITGTTVDISTQIRAAAALLPIAGGAGNPATPALCLQFANSTANAFATVPGLCVDALPGATTLTDPLNTVFKGPNPYIDVTAYGARAVTLPEPQTTVTVNGGSTAATLGSASSFKNGDGVMLVGAGATNSSSTPSAPTVTPSVANGGTGTGVTSPTAAGSTTYNYVIQGIRQGGGLTAASAVGTTATGNALGATPYTISTLSRSNNTVTVTVSAPHILNVGCSAGACGVVYIHDSTDASFSGYFVIASVADSTHFTYLQGMDTRAGATASATGGTAQVYSCNHLVLPAFPTGVIKYLILGRTGATGSLTKIGVSRPGELVFDDYGSPMMDNITLPSYYPTNPAGSATNDNLVTTIVAGGGTTAITLANAASNSAAGAVIKFDAAPGILAAAQAATAFGTAGTIHFPVLPGAGATPYYVVNSYLTLPNILTIWQSNPIELNETMQMGYNSTWFGDVGGTYFSTPSFAWNAAQQVLVNTANPGVFINTVSNGSVVLRGLGFVANNQGLAMIIGQQGGFNFSVEYSSFSMGTNGNDYMGMGIVNYGETNNTFNHVDFVASSPVTIGNSLTPLYYVRNDLANLNGAGGNYMDNTMFIGRGMVVSSVPPSGGAVQYHLHHPYSQGIRMPMLAFVGARSSFVHMDDCTQDSSTPALLANWGANINQAEIINCNAPGNDLGGTPGMVTGNLIAGLRVETTGGPVGQNREVFVRSVATMRIPVYAPASAGLNPVFADNIVAGPMHFPAQHPLFWDMPLVTGVTATVAAGGAVPIGPTYTYAVASVGVVAGGAANGGESVISLPSTTCTPAGGNQTCNVAWSALPGAAAYTVYRNNGTGYFGVAACENITTLTCADAAGGVDGGHVPSAQSGAGLTTIMQNQVVTPQVILSTGTTVAGLPSASTNPGSVLYVTDSTAIAAEGQTCAGGSTNKALAFSNGTVWKCF